MEIKEISYVDGIVKAIRKDGFGLLLATENGKESWYSNQYFGKNAHDICKIGDQVKLSLNNKGFLQDIELISKAPTPVPTETATQRKDYVSEDSSSRTAGMIVSYVKDILCAGKITLEEFDTTAEKLSETFKKIKFHLQD
jgi:hypothetical protein